jgi:DNA-binding transcriptional LysR family regulator
VSIERLDLRLVGYFVAVAEELHFGRAAARVHIAQPSLSHQIRRLESQLGVTLLERNSRSVHLTEAGRALLREGRKTLSQAEHTIRTVRATSAPELRIGFYGSAGSDLLAGALRAFGEEHPSCSVSVRELPFGSIDAILNGEVNVAFTRLNPGQTELEVEVIAHEPRVVALATAHPLAARETLALAELADESFITNPAVADHGARPPRWLAEQQRHGLPGRVAAQSAGVPEILTLVAAGHGVCLVPSAVARHYPRDDIAYVPTEDAEPAVLSLAWREGAVVPGLPAFIKTVRELAARLSGEPQPDPMH